jgi:hypothetical protein
MAENTNTQTPSQPVPKPAGAPRWTYVVGSLVAVGTLLWAVLKDTTFKKDSPSVTPAVQQSATAGDGGTAINAAGNASVTVGPGVSQGAVPESAAAVPAAATNQTAKAASGGTAVNATDSARVKINKP